MGATVGRKTSKLVVDDVEDSDKGNKRKKGAPESRQSHNLEVATDMLTTGKILKRRNADKGGVQQMTKMTLRDTLAPHKGVTMLEATIDYKKTQQAVGRNSNARLASLT